MTTQLLWKDRDNPALMAPPVIGTSTITAEQTELKAGDTVLEGRRQLIIFPPAEGKIYWGADGLTPETGIELSVNTGPVMFDLDQFQHIPIHAISDGTDRQVKVVEAK